jgi:hypothetical protein
MKTTTKTTTVTTSRGTVIPVTATSIRGFEMVNKTYFCDGNNVTITVGRKTSIDALSLFIPSIGKI